MRYHSILDWRLGVSLVCMLASSDYQAGLDGKWTQLELQGWINKANQDTQSFIDSFGLSQREALFQQDLPIFRFNGLIVVVRHPLWDTVDPRGQFAQWIDAAIDDVGNDGKVRSVDSFDLSRRPSWVYQRLAKDDNVFRL